MGDPALLTCKSERTDIAYTHDRNRHSVDGALAGIAYLLAGRSVNSLLDVGAGTGTWLYAARQTGIEDVLGVDGVAAEGRKLWVEPDLIKCADLRVPLRIGRR